MKPPVKYAKRSNLIAIKLHFAWLIAFEGWRRVKRYSISRRKHIKNKPQSSSHLCCVNKNLCWDSFQSIFRSGSRLAWIDCINCSNSNLIETLFRYLIRVNSMKNLIHYLDIVFNTIEMERRGAKKVHCNYTSMNAHWNDLLNLTTMCSD